MDLSTLIKYTKAFEKIHMETASNTLIYDYANQFMSWLGRLCLIWSRQVYVCFKLEYSVHVNVFTCIIIKWLISLPDNLIMTMSQFYFLRNPWFSVYTVPFLFLSYFSMTLLYIYIHCIYMIIYFCSCRWKPFQWVPEPLPLLPNSHPDGSVWGGHWVHVPDWPPPLPRCPCSSGSVWTQDADAPSFYSSSAV